MYEYTFGNRVDCRSDISIKSDKFITFTQLLATLILIYAPYSINTLGTNTLKLLLRMIVYIILGINVLYQIMYIYKHKEKPIYVILGIFSCTVVFILQNLNVYNFNGINGFLNYALLLVFLLSNRKIKINTFLYLKRVWTFIALIGIICYFCYVFTIPLPYKIADYYSNSFKAFYFDYGLCYIYINPINNSPRLCGICNEPGYFGTVSAMLLCADGINLKKKENMIILIAGLLSLSIAFVFILIIYLLLATVKNRKAFIAIAVVSIFYFFIMPNIVTDNQSVNLLISRLTFNNGRISGDNRSNKTIDQTLTLMFHESPLFGYGGGFTSTITSGFATYKSYLIDYGVIGFILMYGSLFISAISAFKNDLRVLFFIVAFFSSIYQRPYVFIMIYFVILFGGIEWINCNAQSGSSEKKL